MAPVAGKSGRVFSSICRRRLFAVALAGLSLVIYGSTIFTLPQVRSARYCCEQSSVAVAVSNVMYHSPLGTLYSGVFEYFYAHLDDEPLEQTLREARTPAIGLPPQPPGELEETTSDGNGVGYPLVATAAFRLFGMHTSALTLTMLLLMALSAAIFLLRFSGAIYVGVVIVYFTALTIMLFTPLVWNPGYAVQIPVGGIRYFSLVAVLPFFHFVLDLIDPDAAKGDAKARVLALLGLQTVILVVVTLVRGSALPLVGAVVLVLCWLVWRRRHDRATLRAVFGKAAVIASVSVCTLAVIAISVPREYLTQGHFGTVIWHRVIQSLGTNPAFPFPGVNDMFDCKKYIPKGIQPGIGYAAGCIWFDYVEKHHTPMETRRAQMYGSLYETAMREAFFRIVARYPAEMLKTFLYYKPRYIVWSMAQSMRFNFSRNNATGAYPGAAIGLLLVSLAIALTYFSITKVAINDLSRIGGVTLLSAAFTVPSYLAVWAMPHTSADLLLYCIFTIVLIIGLGVICFRQVLSRYRGSADVIMSKMETT